MWILNLAGWMDHYYSTQQFQQLQHASVSCKTLVVVCLLACDLPHPGVVSTTKHHHYQLTCYLAASSNAAEIDQTLRGKALLGNL